MATRHGLWLFKNPEMRGPGFLEPAWPLVMASGGSEILKMRRPGFFEPAWPLVMASGGSKMLKMRGPGFFERV